MQPHWPKPWGIEAPAGLQLVIEEEFRAAGVGRVNLSITGWVVLTLVQHGTPEQVGRWVRPALAGEEIWCQLCPKAAGAARRKPEGRGPVSLSFMHPGVAVP